MDLDPRTRSGNDTIAVEPVDPGPGRRRHRLGAVALAVAVAAAGGGAGVAVGALTGDSTERPEAVSIDEQVPAGVELPGSHGETELGVPGDVELEIDLDEPGPLDPEPIVLDEVDPGAAPDELPPSLGFLCTNVDHHDLDSDTTHDGWVRGPGRGTTVWAQGPSFDGGRPVSAPVDDAGYFSLDLNVTAYGDHPIEVFALGGPDGPGDVDLVPVLAGSDRSVVPVGPDEGPAFADECVAYDADGRVLATGRRAEVEVLALDADAAPSPTDPAEPMDPAPPSGSTLPGGEVGALGVEWADGFVDHHRRGDSAGLLAGLHPAVIDAYGIEVCEAYVTATTGSVAAVRVLEIGAVDGFRLDTPDGPVDFAETIELRLELTTPEGATTVADAHLPLEDGTVYWLTTCGVTGP